MHPKPTSRIHHKTGSKTLSVTSLLCAAGGLSAQAAAPSELKPQIEEIPTEMPEVVIEASGSVYNPQRLQSPKYTEPLRDIAQTITVVPRAVIEDRGAFTLRDVLKNTPGISMQAGEGGTASGDNLSIRGFSARSDIYLDGLRDYASYNRDPFNTEQVEIAKGPSSSTVGRGSTGGSINTVSKMANLTNNITTTATIGTSSLYRGTLDVNEKLSEHAAFRLNSMVHEANTPGRDNVSVGRYGIGASLGLGLGTDTRFMLNYQRLEESNIPDYGLPWIPNNGTFSGRGAALVNSENKAPPVSFNTFYGLRGVDYEKIQTDHFTAIFEHDFTKNVRIRNATRYSRSHRDSVATSPRLRDDDPTPAVDYNTALNRQQQRRLQTTEMFGNQTNLVANFESGAIKHALVTGMEFYLEHQSNANAAGISSVTDLFNTSVNLPPSAVPAPNAQDLTKSTYPGLPQPTEAYLYTVSAYVFDTMKIGKHWEISGGLRYDHMYATVSGPGGSSAGSFANGDDLFSYKAAVIYKPMRQGSIYLGYGTSFNPTIDGASNAGLGLSTSATNNTSTGLNPEHTSTYELGTKWDLMKERLSLTAALFHTEKTNARTTDANGLTTVGGNQQVQGLEFSITGNITKNWQIFAGTALMESKTKASSATGDLGQVLSNAPPLTFNLWTTYTIMEKTQIGFGPTYMGSRTSSNGATATSGVRTAPGYWTMDAMLSYKVTSNFSLRLNVYNLANERYIGSVGGGQFIPGAGRSAALTASIKF